MKISTCDALVRLDFSHDEQGHRKEWNCHDRHISEHAYAIGRRTCARRPASAQRCKTLANLDQPVRSIAWVTAKKRWIAVLSANKVSGGRQRPGVYFADSPNLLRWNAPRLIAEAAMSLVGPEYQQRRWFYPVILDPGSKSRNFDTIDHSDALLIFVAHRAAKGKGPINKNLVAVKVRIS